MSTLNELRQKIINDKENEAYTKSGIMPLYQASNNSKILIIGQAPGLKAQNKNKLFDDDSGNTLREWLGLNNDEFYNPDLVAILPMDFYFPGVGKTGDLPPRKNFSDKWHKEFLKIMPNIKLTILIGNYALKHYLKDGYNKNLTETVRNYQSYLPQTFPLIHPSKRNFRWHLKNKWFIDEVIPKLQTIIKEILK